MLSFDLSTYYSLLFKSRHLLGLILLLPEYICLTSLVSVELVTFYMCEQLQACWHGTQEALSNPSPVLLIT